MDFVSDRLGSVQGVRVLQVHDESAKDVEYEGAGDPLEGVRQSIEMLERLGLHYAG